MSNSVRRNPQIPLYWGLFKNKKKGPGISFTQYSFEEFFRNFLFNIK